MTTPPRKAILAGVLSFCAALPALAQSAQPFSIQASGLVGAMSWNNHQQPGFGGEGQFRFNHIVASESGVLSLGVGGQFTNHGFADGDIRITGVFLEPRYAFAVGGPLFPYLAGRVSLLQQSGDVLDGSSGYAFGGGGGFALAMSPRVNLDLGAAVLYQGFSNTKVTKGGANVEFSPFVGYAVKLGLSFGL